MYKYKYKFYFFVNVQISNTKNSSLIEKYMKLKINK